MGERQFGPYRLVQQIAVGGMAEIHLAKTHGIAGFEKYVALKMIHPNFSQDQQFIQMLIDEAKITVQLQHVNIAQTFDLGRVGETFYITMEYVDGADLYKLLRKCSELDRQFSIPLASFIAKEVASGLDYAHRKRDHTGAPLGIVHRDVSPQNVLISYAGEVKLVDFGIAKASMRVRQTAVGVIKGKYYYMSPEQAWGEPLDQRTDIFSAGILLYETLTGQMLYLEEDLHKLLDMVRRADIPPPSTIRPDVPPQLDAIAMRALAKRREDRYQSAGDLANDLERFLHAYAPVFTANKVSSWIIEVLGHAASPTLLDMDEQPEEPARGETRRLTRDQLVRARSEFTDENSIIFAFAGGEQGGERPPGLDDGSTFDAPMPGLGEAEDVDSLPEAPRDQAPSGLRAGSARMAAGPSVRVPLPGPERAATRPIEPREDVPGYVEPPTLRRLPGVTPGEPLARPTARLPTAAASPRGRDQETRLLKEPVEQPIRRLQPARQPIVPAPAAEPVSGEAPTEILTDEPSPPESSPDEETIISDAPNWWSGPGDHTEVAAEPFGDHGFPPAPLGDPGFPPAPLGDIDQEPPTLLKVPPVKGPPPGWQPAPALAARVSQPAVSAIRPPRISRRTPAGGISARSGPGLAAHGDEPTDSVLAALLAPERRVPEVALSPPSPLADPRPPALGEPRVPPVARAPGPPAIGSSESVPSSFPLPAPQQSFSTRAMAAALERDEIPDHYKIRRAGGPAPWLIALFALVLSAAVAAVLIAIYGTGDAQIQEEVIQLISVPTGATVTVDGRELPEQTPTTMRGEPGKTFLIRFSLPRYQTKDREYTVEQGKKQQVVVSLDAVFVKLSVDSVPPGAEIFINGRSVGRTPMVLSTLDPQTTPAVELRLKGYRPVRELLDWSKETEKKLNIQLSP